MKKIYSFHFVTNNNNKVCFMFTLYKSKTNNLL